MKITKLDEYPKGWFVGHFDEAVVKSLAAEVAVKAYKAGDKDQKHYHKVAIEISVIIRGKMKMNDTELNVGDVVVIEPDEIVEFSCIEDGEAVVVKLPSAPGDKYLC